MYERLFASQGSDDVLHFDSIAKIAISKGGTLNRPKLKALIHVFRPARDGTLTMIDFLKSTDCRLQGISSSTGVNRELCYHSQGL